MTTALQTARLGEIPILWAEPAGAGTRPLVLWLHAFSWSKEDVASHLVDLAARGFVAVSWDLPQHGERSSEAPDEIRLRVRSNLRRYFWPILAQGADEVPAIIDWAFAHFEGLGDVGIGGISMGGDIAVVSAGIDRRIKRVAPVLATPDWLRPGSQELQGVAEEEQWALYRRLDPLTNVAHYRHCPAMLFVCGAADRQVPPEGAEAFISTMGKLYPDGAEHVAIARQAGIAHRFTPWMWSKALAWFEAGCSPEASLPR